MMIDPKYSHHDIDIIISAQRRLLPDMDLPQQLPRGTVLYVSHPAHSRARTYRTHRLSVLRAAASMSVTLVLLQISSILQSETLQIKVKSKYDNLT